jgi:hypothetical protein
MERWVLAEEEEEPGVGTGILAEHRARLGMGSRILEIRTLQFFLITTKLISSEDAA